MIYCVVPRALESQLFEKLTAHYASNPEVTVIVDRREAERRKRFDASAHDHDHERVLRDRRRRRAPGEFAPLRGESAPLAAR